MDEFDSPLPRPPKKRNRVAMYLALVDRMDGVPAVTATGVEVRRYEVDPAGRLGVLSRQAIGIDFLREVSHALRRLKTYRRPPRDEEWFADRYERLRRLGRYARLEDESPAGLLELEAESIWDGRQSPARARAHAEGGPPALRTAHEALLEALGSHDLRALALAFPAAYRALVDGWALAMKEDPSLDPKLPRALVRASIAGDAGVVAATAELCAALGPRAQLETVAPPDDEATPIFRFAASRLRAGAPPDSVVHLLTLARRGYGLDLLRSYDDIFPEGHPAYLPRHPDPSSLRRAIDWLAPRCSTGAEREVWVPIAVSAIERQALGLVDLAFGRGAAAAVLLDETLFVLAPGARGEAHVAWFRAALRLGGPPSPEWTGPLVRLGIAWIEAGNEGGGRLVTAAAAIPTGRLRWVHSVTSRALALLAGGDEDRAAAIAREFSRYPEAVASRESAEALGWGIEAARESQEVQDWLASISVERMAAALRFLLVLGMAHRLLPGEVRSLRAGVLPAHAHPTGPLAEAARYLPPEDLGLLERLAGRLEAARLPARLERVLRRREALEAEVEALERLAAPGSRLERRLANRRAVLADPGRLARWIARDLSQGLARLVEEIELVSAITRLETSLVERALRPALGAEIPDARARDLLHLAAGTRENRRFLRRALAAWGDGRARWPLDHPANRMFLVALGRAGVRTEAWTDGLSFDYATRRGRLRVSTEDDVFEILRMGTLFGTCLSLGDINCHSVVVNATEANKRVVYARDGSGRVVGRKLLVATPDGRLLGFETYGAGARTVFCRGQPCTVHRRPEVLAALDAFSRELAARAGLALDAGEAFDADGARLIAREWYCDHPVPFLADAPWTGGAWGARLRTWLLSSLDEPPPAAPAVLPSSIASFVQIALLGDVPALDAMREELAARLDELGVSAAERHELLDEVRA